MQDGINGSVPVQLKPQEINVKLVPSKFIHVWYVFVMYTQYNKSYYATKVV